MLKNALTNKTSAHVLKIITNYVRKNYFKKRKKENPEEEKEEEKQLDACLILFLIIKLL